MSKLKNLLVALDLADKKRTIIQGLMIRLLLLVIVMVVLLGVVFLFIKFIPKSNITIWHILGAIFLIITITSLVTKKKPSLIGNQKPIEEEHLQTKDKVVKEILDSLDAMKIPENNKKSSENT